MLTCFERAVCQFLVYHAFRISLARESFLLFHSIVELAKELWVPIYAVLSVGRPLRRRS